MALTPRPDMAPTTNARAERDERLTNQRLERGAQDRASTQDREITDAERRALLRGHSWQNALFDLPEIPGYHTCWLTTTNPRDPIHGRMRLGYELLKAADFPGLNITPLSTGEYAGTIMVNEMVAAKLPIDLYRMYMQDVHHEQPLDEERRLNAVIDVIREEAARRQLKVEEGDGTAEMSKTPNVRPRFEGVPN